MQFQISFRPRTGDNDTLKLLNRDKLSHKTDKASWRLKHEKNNFFEQFPRPTSEVIKCYSSKSELKHRLHSTHHLEILFKHFLSFE